MIICFPQCNRSQESCGQLHKYCSIHGNKIPNFHPRFSADLHRVLIFHRPVKTTAGWKLSTEYTTNKAKVTERYHSHRKFKCFFKNCSQFCFLKLVAYSHQNQLSLVSATDIFKSNDVLSSNNESQLSGMHPSKTLPYLCRYGRVAIFKTQTTWNYTYV